MLKLVPRKFQIGGTVLILSNNEYDDTGDSLFQMFATKLENKNSFRGGLTDDQIVDAYLNHVVWPMENPDNRGLMSNGRYQAYTDLDANKNKHINFGPGIESNSSIGKNLNYRSSYTKAELNRLLRPLLLNNIRTIRQQVNKMHPNHKLVLGDYLVLLDIAHNVSPRGQNKNMPQAWPSLTRALVQKDYGRAYKEAYSGSTRRQNMRKLLFGILSVGNIKMINL